MELYLLIKILVELCLDFASPDGYLNSWKFWWNTASDKVTEILWIISMLVDVVLFPYTFVLVNRFLLAEKQKAIFMCSFSAKFSSIERSEFDACML